MATANHVQLDVSLRPAYHRDGITEQSTETATRLLQKNHEDYHMFFNNAGFHNHLAHQMLTMWALKASSDQLKREFDHNTHYQRPSKSPSSKIVAELQDPKKFMSYLGPQKHYNDFLEFFRHEIDRLGWQDTIKRYVLAGDERAEAMLVRMYGGLLHPIIHLGFGIEFQQPAIVAEALAQTACHDDDLGKALFLAEKMARERKDAGSKSIVQLIDEMRANKAARAVEYMAQVRLTPGQLEEKTAEMANAVAYYTGGVNKPNSSVNIDFFWMHALNASIFFSAFLKQDWLSQEDKVRLLEWKIRTDLSYYSSHGAPEVGVDVFRQYKPRKNSGWDEIEDRVVAINDDGHASKLIRALANGAKICKPYERKDAFRLKGEDWLQFGHMAIDKHEPITSNGHSRF